MGGSCCLCCCIANTDSRVLPWIERRCFLTASCALHIVMAAFKVSSCCWSKCSTVSWSSILSMTWSLMLFCVQALEQKLQVFVSSLRATRKSSKLSPGYCLWLCKLRRSTDSLIWPSMCRLIACMIALESFRCSSDRLRLFTMERVSLDKHNVNTCTLVSADSPANPNNMQ